MDIKEQIRKGKRISKDQGIEKKPFRQYHTQDEKKREQVTLGLKLNKDQLEMIKKAGLVLQQTKRSTIIKILMTYGYKSIFSDPNAYLLDTISKNVKNNNRIGIMDVETEIQQK